MSSIAPTLAAMGSLWGETVLAANASLPPSVYEVPSSLRNVFPAVNFNRDVTTSWWETSVLDGHDVTAASEATATLREASYIVLDKDMYQVRTSLANGDTTVK